MLSEWYWLGMFSYQPAIWGSTSPPELEAASVKCSSTMQPLFHEFGCFLKALVSTASWGKVLHCLTTCCVQSLCFSLVFHLPPSCFMLCPWFLPRGDSTPIVPSLVPPWHTSDLWTSVVPMLGHFISSLFCLVIPGREAVPQLWSPLWPFPELFLVQIYPFWGWRSKTIQGIQGAVCQWSGQWIKKWVGEIYLDFERLLTKAIKKLSRHWLKVKELLLQKKQEGINFHQWSVFIIAKP